MKTYLWPNNHVYSAFYGKQTVILDLKKDQYILLDESQSILFREILEGKIFSENNSFAGTQPDQLNTLLKLDFFCPRDTPYPHPIPEQKNIEGMSNIDFRSPVRKFNFNWKTLQALWVLIHANISVKCSFYRTIKRIKKYQESKVDYRIPSQIEIDAMTETLCAACLLFPWKTKCLEWSIALATLCLKARFCCDLVIGVQTPPFYAHAWVECNGKVIADSQQLPNKMAVILREGVS